MIAFKVPADRYDLAELRFFSYRLHCDPCSRISPAMYHPPRKCGACIEKEREHDHGDEEPGAFDLPDLEWVIERVYQSGNASST